MNDGVLSLSSTTPVSQAVTLLDATEHREPLTEDQRSKRAELLGLTLVDFTREIFSLLPGTLWSFFHPELLAQRAVAFVPTFVQEWEERADDIDQCTEKFDAMTALDSEIRTRLTTGGEQNFVADSQLILSLSTETINRIFNPDDAAFFEELRLAVAWRANLGPDALLLNEDAALQAEHADLLEKIAHQQRLVDEAKRLAANRLAVSSYAFTTTTERESQRLRGLLADLTSQAAIQVGENIPLEPGSLSRQLDLAAAAPLEVPRPMGLRDNRFVIVPEGPTPSDLAAAAAVLARGTPIAQSGCKVIVDEDGVSYTVASAPEAHKHLLASYFVRRACSPAILDQFMTSYGTELNAVAMREYLKQPVMPTLFRSKGNETGVANPTTAQLVEARNAKFLRSERVSEIQHIFRLPVMYDKAVFSRWAIGKECSLQQFMPAGRELVALMDVREAVGNIALVHNHALGGHFKGSLDDLEHVLYDERLEAFAPVNYVISIIQVRYNEWQRCLRVPRYRPGVDEQAYPQHLQPVSHTASLLRVLMRDVYAEAMDHLAKDRYLKDFATHDGCGHIIPIIDGVVQSNMKDLPSFLGAPTPSAPPAKPGNHYGPAQTPPKGAAGAGKNGRGPLTPDQKLEQAQREITNLKRKRDNQQAAGGGRGGGGRDGRGGRASPAVANPRGASRDTKIKDGGHCVTNAVFLCLPASSTIVDCTTKGKAPNPCPWRHGAVFTDIDGPLFKQHTESLHHRFFPQATRDAVYKKLGV